MILIVDDDNAIRLSLGLMLKRAGYEVDYAENPSVALEKIRGPRFDLILMDMNYGRSTTGEDGIELNEEFSSFSTELRLRAVCMRCSKTRLFQGFVTKSYAPAFIPSTASSMLPQAVIRITGVSG